MKFNSISIFNRFWNKNHQEHLISQPNSNKLSKTHKFSISIQVFLPNSLAIQFPIKSQLNLN